MSVTTVLLVDDHRLVRSGIRSLLEGSAEVRVVGEAGNGREAVEMCAQLEPQVVLADVEMREMNGIETVRQLRAAQPELKVVMLSMYGDPQYVLEALRAGAHGYVLKDAAFAELLTAIKTVAAGRRYFSAPLADHVMDDYVRRAGGGPAATSDLDKLSAREREVLQLVAEGRSSAEMAAVMHISVRTVDAHRHNVMQKLGIHSIAGLTKFAIVHGITPLR